MNLRYDFWIPKFKHCLVDALSEIWPQDRPKFKRMNLKRLKAIWITYNLKKRREDHNEAGKKDGLLAGGRDFPS